MRLGKWSKLGLGVLFTLVFVAGNLILGVRSQNFVRPACGCGFVNVEVAGDLERLDALVQQYAAEHHGDFPTYRDLLALTSSLKQFDRGYLISRVDLLREKFSFTVAAADVYKIGYAVSEDRDRYVLLGVGQTDIYKGVYFYGIELWIEDTGLDDLPILRPGDTPPPPRSVR